MSAGGAGCFILNFCSSSPCVERVAHFVEVARASVASVVSELAAALPKIGTCHHGAGLLKIGASRAVLFGSGLLRFVSALPERRFSTQGIVNTRADAHAFH